MADPLSGTVIGPIFDPSSQRATKVASAIAFDIPKPSLYPGCGFLRSYLSIFRSFLRLSLIGLKLKTWSHYKKCQIRMKFKFESSQPIYFKAPLIGYLRCLTLTLLFMDLHRPQ